MATRLTHYDLHHLQRKLKVGTLKELCNIYNLETGYPLSEGVISNSFGNNGFLSLGYSARLSSFDRTIYLMSILSPEQRAQLNLHYTVERIFNDDY